MYKEIMLDLLRMKALEHDGEVAAVLGELEEEVKKWPDATRKIKKYTPIHKGSPIVYPSWRCTNCGYEERTVKGMYCRMCGRRFEG